MKLVCVLAVLSIFGASLLPAAGLPLTQDRKPVVSLETDPVTGRNDNSRPFTEIEEEMRAKRAIKYAEEEYQENLDRARDLSVLGAAIVTSYKQKQTLNHDDIKKLEKVEKLAKGIRRAAGGSEDDTEIEKPPANMSAAIDMLGNLSHSLKEKVEKTPKRVISAAVIDEANVLLELIRIVRNLTPRV